MPLSFSLLALGPRSLLLQACLYTSSPSAISLTVLCAQDEFSSSPSNSFPPASFFFCFYPILFPFFLVFSFFLTFPPVPPPQFCHVSISFGSACLPYTYCLVSSPHISMFSLHVPYQAPWQVCSPHPMAWPVCSWVSRESPRLLLLPTSKLPVPEFFQCHFPCPHLGWMEETNNHRGGSNLPP